MADSPLTQALRRANRQANRLLKTTNKLQGIAGASEGSDAQKTADDLERLGYLE